MKKIKLNSKLNLKKEQIANLNDVKGGDGEKHTFEETCHNTWCRSLCVNEACAEKPTDLNHTCTGVCTP